MRLKVLVLSVLLFLVTPSLFAAETTFHFGKSGQRTNITFESETDFEVILGSTNEISGDVTADLTAGTGRLELEVPVASLRTGIAARDKHLQSKNWLNAKQFPLLSFVSSKVEKLSRGKWEVTGTFTMHGVSKEITVTVDVRSIPAAVAKKAGLEKGDWIRVNVPFELKLSDFGVKVSGRAAAKVNDTWKVRILAFATTG